MLGSEQRRRHACRDRERCRRTHRYAEPARPGKGNALFINDIRPGLRCRCCGGDCLQDMGCCSRPAGHNGFARFNGSPAPPAAALGRSADSQSSDVAEVPEWIVTWFFLVDGAPPSPAGWDWDALASMPRPTAFFGQLCAELCGTTALPLHMTEERLVPREERVTTGFCGTKEVGYRWVERECLETSAVPYNVAVETYGLPGMEVHWDYCFDDAGQAGHAAFRHVSLKARFDDSGAERRFTQVWRKVFKTVPLWEAAPGP
jgi:hypothetical protein